MRGDIREPSPKPTTPAAVWIVIAVVVLAAVLAGLVAGLALGSARKLARRADVRTTKLQLIVVETAIGEHLLEHGELPAALDELVGPDGYLDSDEVPPDAWGHALAYEVFEQDGSARYRLSSLGRDGRPGGLGLDADIVRGTPHRRGE